MGTRPIPNQDEGLADMAPDMLQTNQQFLRIDRAIKMAFINLATDGQSHQRRRLPAKFRDPLEHRGLALRRPGKTDRFGIGQPKFICKDDLSAELLRFFLFGANPGPTRLGSALHLARWLADLVFAHSSPCHVATG